LSTVRQPLAAVAAECVRTLSLILGDRAVASAVAADVAGGVAMTTVPSPRESASAKAATRVVATSNDSRPSDKYHAGGAGTPDGPMVRHVLLVPELVVRESG
jgi:hypothetical protein